VPQVTVPPDKDPLVYVWTELAPALAGPAGAFSSAVYERSSLPLREFEAARMTMARINECQLCISWRTAAQVPSRATAGPDEVPESFYRAVGERDWSQLTEREALAAEFAERYATDHLHMDAPFWERLHAAYDDAELVDLALCVASWLALGRFNQVFDIDGGCRVPAPGGTPEAAAPAAAR
jgi:alkylhydroperoxidase family enzyme